MRVLRALVGKELRQHALVGLALGVFVALAYGIVLLGALANDGVTVLEAHATFARILLPVIAMFLGHRLIVTEWFGRTVQFLEALPMPRAAFLGVKAGLFAAVLLGAAVGSQALVFGVASLRESVDGAYFAVVLARTLAWATFLFAFFLASALAGRWRYPFYALVGLAAWATDTIAKIDVADHGPLALVNHTFVLERRVLPVEPIVSALAASAILLAAAAVIAVARGGALAAAVAGRLTARERSAAGALVLAGLISISAIDQEPERFDPVARGPGWIATTSPPLRLHHGEAAHEADASRLFLDLSAELTALAPVVGPEMPAAFVVLRDGLAPGQALREGEGEVPVVWTAPATRASPALRAALAEQVILARTEGRADFEPQAWLLPAFGGWFAGRAEPEVDPGVLRRALAATGGRPVTAALVRRWHRTRERLGEPLSTALATTGLEALAARRGDGAVMALARAFYDRPARTSSLTIVDDWLESPDERFERATGLSWLEFLRAWNEWLAARRRAAPAGGPRPRAAIENVAGGGALRSLRLRLAGAPTARLRHIRLGPFDEALDERSLLTATTHELTFVYGPGDRVFVAVEVDDPALGCPVRLFARRFEVR